MLTFPGALVKTMYVGAFETCQQKSSFLARSSFLCDQRATIDNVHRHGTRAIKGSKRVWKSMFSRHNGTHFQWQDWLFLVPFRAIKVYFCRRVYFRVSRLVLLTDFCWRFLSAWKRVGKGRYLCRHILYTFPGAWMHQ